MVEQTFSLSRECKDKRWALIGPTLVLSLMAWCPLIGPLVVVKLPTVLAFCKLNGFNSSDAKIIFSTFWWNISYAFDCIGYSMNLTTMPYTPMIVSINFWLYQTFLTGYVFHWLSSTVSYCLLLPLSVSYCPSLILTVSGDFL